MWKNIHNILSWIKFDQFTFCNFDIEIVVGKSIFCSDVTSWENFILQTTLLPFFFRTSDVNTCSFCCSAETVWSHVLHQAQKLAVRNCEGIDSMIGMFDHHATVAICWKSSLFVSIMLCILLSSTSDSWCYMIRFTELCSVMDPGKPPKTDKSAILSDATRLMNHLRLEAKKLKDSNEALKDAIKSLKVTSELLSYSSLFMLLYV